ncbi:hypothetical protein ELE36_00860 [Pseudolysobacter antarcticus]|uniref:Uncharacterized protein n=1 Tax=Pseudolysobacter antarcticus TaxID=2511995 RepID=A0A411HEY4_9GAMM|nr:hypothetical protein [Pseudolysobacter antarcticus]QBB69046.1 hypothetical protein ELE36_00860 [Pseudolysobacter antarcticus]
MALNALACDYARMLGQVVAAVGTTVNAMEALSLQDMAQRVDRLVAFEAALTGYYIDIPPE